MLQILSGFESQIIFKLNEETAQELHVLLNTNFSCMFCHFRKRIWLKQAELKTFSKIGRSFLYKGLIVTVIFFVRDSCKYNDCLENKTCRSINGFQYECDATITDCESAIQSLALEIVRFSDSYLEDSKCSNHRTIKDNIMRTTSTTTEMTSTMKMSTQTSKSNSKPSKSISTSESNSSPFAVYETFTEWRKGKQFACLGVTILPGTQNLTRIQMTHIF